MVLLSKLLCYIILLLHYRVYGFIVFKQLFYVTLLLHCSLIESRLLFYFMLLLHSNFIVTRLLFSIILFYYYTAVFRVPNFQKDFYAILLL